MILFFSGNAHTPKSDNEYLPEKVLLHGSVMLTYYWLGETEAKDNRAVKRFKRHQQRRRV